MKKTITFVAALFVALTTLAQSENSNKVVVTGSVQSDILIPQEDDNIGTGSYDSDVLMNNYVDLNLTSRYVDAGLRGEYMEHPLPGYEKDFSGWGLPHFWVKGKLGKTELTAGTFYEQFGSGFILRTYEERSLGIDNSILGARLATTPVKGVNVKVLGGKQRRYWDWNDAWLTGADIVLNIDQWSPRMQESSTFLSVGASWLNKHEDEEDIMTDATHKLNLPENVNAFDVRAQFQKGNVSVLAEYAHKTQDPSFDNGYIYRPGYVAMLSASYSKRGMSLLLQAKRSDNMSFRSRRSMNGSSSMLNHLPAFTLDHTYDLPAMYPYATQPMGEWAYQAELGYQFKRGTALGGKYGTNVKLNFSHVHSLDKNERSTIVERAANGSPLTEIMGRGSDGYGSSFWKWGDQMYYQDLNIQIEKKFSRQFKLNLMYMNQFYNMTAIEGEGGMIHSDIFVAEGKYQFNKKLTLRGELQYLSTKDDEGDWAYGLLELSVLPYLMFTVSDEWNCGETDLHYYMFSATFNTGNHRIMAGYGRTSSGFNCSGGVCRYVPAQKGFSLSYNYNF
ncbi:MAG: DUF6029 family protein [Prevotella sp.]|nr:DUF6029 family protein [Prevotella sp.]